MGQHFERTEAVDTEQLKKILTKDENHWSKNKSKGSPLDTEVHLKGQTTWRVYYEDTDFSGYVYHANYLKFFERGREELLGVEKLQELFKKGLHFVVAKIQISYHKPLVMLI